MSTSIYNHYKQTITFATPLIISQAAQMGLEVVDTIMIGHLGKEQLASAALSGITYISVLIFFYGLLSALGVTISRHLGAKEHSLISSNLFQGIFLALTLSLPAIVIIWLIPKFFLLIGQDPVVVGYSEKYLHAVIYGIPGDLLYVTLREFSIAMFYPRIVMLITVCAIPCNALFNYILMYGNFGFPTLGIAGAGFGTALVNWLMPTAMLCYILAIKKLRLHIIKLRFQKLHQQLIVDILRIGWPIGVTLSFEVGLFSVTAILMGYFGTNSLAAHQIAMQISGIAFTFLFGLSQACAIRVSHTIGAGRAHEVKTVAYSALHIGLAIATIAAATFFIFPRDIANIFFNAYDPENRKVLANAVAFLHIAAIFQFSDALQVIMHGALRGLKDTFIPMFLGLISYWLIGLGVGATTGFYFELEGRGLWIGLTVGLMASGFLLWWRFIYQVRTNLNLTK